MTFKIPSFFLFHRLFVLLLVCLPAGQSVLANESSSTDRFLVQYDAVNNLLAIRSEQTELRHLLGSLTIRSGIETVLDPAASQRVTINFSQLPLDRGIKKLCQSLNCIVRSSKTEDGQVLITRLEVLPGGLHQSENLQPVVPLVNELGIHSRIFGSPRMQALVQKRLEARLDRLAPEKRDKVLADFQRKVQRRQQQRAKHEELKRYHQNLREEKGARQLAEEEQLKQEDPERYERRLRQRQQRQSTGKYQ